MRGSQILGHACPVGQGLQMTVSYGSVAVVLVAPPEMTVWVTVTVLFVAAVHVAVARLSLARDCSSKEMGRAPVSCQV